MTFYIILGLAALTLGVFTALLLGAAYSGSPAAIGVLLGIAIIVFCGAVYTGSDLKETMERIETIETRESIETTKDEDIFITVHRLEKEGFSENEICRVLASLYNISEDEAKEYLE